VRLFENKKMTTNFTPILVRQKKRTQGKNWGVPDLRKDEPTFKSKKKWGGEKKKTVVR